MEIDYSLLSPEVLRAMEEAAATTYRCGRRVVTPSDFIVGACANNVSVVCSWMERADIDLNSVMQQISRIISDMPEESTLSEGVMFGNEILLILSKICDKSRSRLSAASLSDALDEMFADGKLAEIIERLRPVAVQQNPRNPSADDNSTGATVKEFCVNMLSLAADGKIRPAIGRDEEIQRVLRILARKSKNNPVLVGPPGVGKTAIAEGLAFRLLHKQVPEDLQQLKLYSLDYNTIKSLPDPEGVMKEILQEASADSDLVLFIDEVHILISNCDCSDNDIANMMKPAMARGEIKILGATTIDEYTQHIEKDPAFERRFQKVIVDEPSEDVAIKIISGAKKHFEEHHEISIPSSVVKDAVTLSIRYIPARKLPDKAFDLLDEAAAQVRLDEPARKELVANDLMKVVTAWTGIPVHEMTENDTQRLRNIESELHSHVIGQDRAVKVVSDAIRRNRMGFSDATKPIGSFLFLGTTGTGKTELCKAIARFLFRDANMMVRIDMSEYQQEYSTARLFGAPPGYVGYEQGGQLTEAVRQKPYSVVLFDEIEKAHPKVFESLLQVLDDGRMTDGQGRLVDFKNTIIVMTSNMGQQQILSSLCGREVSNEDVARCTDGVMLQLRSRVAPEFLNRIDNIVMFMPLSREDVREIAKLNMAKEQKKLANKNVNVSFTPEVTDYIVERGYVPEYGGRPVKRAITDHIINPLTMAMINGTVDKNKPVLVSLTNNQLTFTNGTTS